MTDKKVDTTKTADTCAKVDENERTENLMNESFSSPLLSTLCVIFIFCSRVKKYFATNKWILFTLIHSLKIIMFDWKL